MLLFFQINLDICVPLVVSQNIRQIWRVWQVRAKQVGECRRVLRVRANQVGECRWVWRVRANQVGKCGQVWRVRHISEKGHFCEYSNSPKMANFWRVLEFAKFAGEWPLLIYSTTIISGSDELISVNICPKLIKCILIRIWYCVLKNVHGSCLMRLLIILPIG